MVTDSTAQHAEPDPSEVLEADDIDKALRYLMEQASPEERAKINNMAPAEREELAMTAYKDPDHSDKILGRKA